MLQLNLRTLLLIVLAAGAGCGWVINSTNDHAEEQMAIQEVLKCGVYKTAEFSPASIYQQMNEGGDPVLSTSYM